MELRKLESEYNKYHKLDIVKFSGIINKQHYFNILKVLQHLNVLHEFKFQDARLRKAQEKDRRFDNVKKVNEQYLIGDCVVSFSLDVNSGSGFAVGQFTNQIVNQTLNNNFNPGTKTQYSLTQTQTSTSTSTSTSVSTSSFFSSDLTVLSVFDSRLFQFFLLAKDITDNLTSAWKQKQNLSQKQLLPFQTLKPTQRKLLYKVFTRFLNPQRMEMSPYSADPLFYVDCSKIDSSDEEFQSTLEAELKEKTSEQRHAS